MQRSSSNVRGAPPSHVHRKLLREVEPEHLVVEVLVLAEVVLEGGVQVATEGEHGLLGEHGGDIHCEDQGGRFAPKDGVNAHLTMEGGVVQLDHGSEVGVETSQVPEVPQLQHQRSRKHSCRGAMGVVVEHRLEFAHTLVEGGCATSISTEQRFHHLVVYEGVGCHQYQRESHPVPTLFCSGA